MTFNLLALDGGGIRGYMTARILKELEAKAKISFNDAATVHGYCGTSTGGLLAIALANGHTPERLQEIYRHRAKDIFEPNDSKDFIWLIRFLSKFYAGFEKLISGIGFLSSQYTAKGLSSIAEELVGDKTFGDFDQKRVLAVNTAAMKIPGSVEGWTSTTMCNHSLQGSRIGDSRNISLIDGALSTSAAPSYFPPHEVRVDGKSLGFFADGGVFANNPVLNGMTVAKAAQLVERDDEFRVISIGTGVHSTGLPPSVFKRPLGFGLLEWFGLHDGVPPGALLDITMTTSADNMTWVSNNMLGKNIVRLNPELSTNIGLDDHSDHAFDVMNAAVKKLFGSKDWEDAVTLAKTWADPAIS